MRRVTSRFKSTDLLRRVVKVNITSIVHGAGLAWLSPNLTILQSEDSPIGRPISNEEGSWLGSLLCLGACIGTPVYHLLTYYCSRKLTGYLVALPYLITYILTIRADSIFILYIARFISGLGTAATTAFCPIYVTEISQVTERGSLGTFFILIRNIGVLSIYVLGAYATFVTSAYILLCTTILYIFTFYFVPESPLYCMSKNNFAKARMSLIWLRGNREDVIDYELSEIATSLRQKQSLKSTSFVEMISSRGNRRGMAIALLLVTNLQFCAPLPILAYTHTIFEAAGSKLSPNISSIIAATLYIAGSAMSTFLMDRAVNLISLNHGGGLGWLSPILPILQSETSPIGRPVTNEEGSWLSSLLCLGAVFGTPLYTIIINRFSRKVSGYLVAVPHIAANVLILVANSLEILYVARFLAGVGTAAVTVFTPVYVTEIAADNVRGSLGTFYVLMCNFGVLLVYIIGSYTSYNITAYVLLSVTMFYLMAFCLMPETPTYLVRKSDMTAAVKSLKWLRGEKYQADQEISSLVSALKTTQCGLETTSYKQMLQSQGTKKALMISLLLMINLQMSAPIAILSYTVSIFKEAGSELSPSISSIIVAVLQIFGALLATTLLDRAGRKLLLSVSNAFMTACMMALGGYFFCKTHAFDMPQIAWLPLVCLSIYVIAQALGVSPIPFLMIPELFLPEARNNAILLCQIFMWVIAFVVTKFFATISDFFGLYTCYWVFGIFCFIGFFLSMFIYPETKNQRIEDIFEKLNAKR
ncbi:hypothetical protein C0J52_07381 [Blattella germanica]|nr:hypothetical protein C0J52_07381 [Blattella germanica]